MAFDQYQISLKKFNVLSKITTGFYINTKLIEDSETHKKYIAKTIKHLYLKREKEREMVQVEIMTRLKHPTIIGLHGFSPYNFKHKEQLTIILEHSTNGDLSTFLRKKEINNTQRQIILAGVSHSILLLHQHNYVHRYINPSNVMIDENCHPKLSGLELAVLHNEDDAFTEIVGNIPYMAPEVYDTENSNNKIDIYSFSLLMYEVVTLKKVHFPRFNRSKDYIKHVNNGFRPVLNDTVKKSIRNLIEDCWSCDPFQRPTAQELFDKLSSDQNYFLDGVDLDEFNAYIKSIL